MEPPQHLHSAAQLGNLFLHNTHTLHNLHNACPSGTVYGTVSGAVCIMYAPAGHKPTHPVLPPLPSSSRLSGQAAGLCSGTFRYTYRGRADQAATRAARQKVAHAADQRDTRKGSASAGEGRRAEYNGGARSRSTAVPD